ncbi:MAG: aminodeoxychorismate synthase component I [Candidatus Omnitrophota bacterium]
MNSYKLKISPFEAFTALKNERNCFFLDSSLTANHSLGRFSFLGIAPFHILEAKNKNPLGKIRELLEKYKIPAPAGSLPFLGGAVGYLAYDLGFLLEKKLRKVTADDLGTPDCFFGFYNTVVIFDNIKKALYICAAGFPEKSYHLAKALCKTNLKKIHKLLSRVDFYKTVNKKGKLKDLPAKPESDFTREEYISAVNKAKGYIRNGDIYQVNISQRFKAVTGLSAFEIYKRLRQISPSYFSAYLDCQNFQILSSSPERFLNLNGGIVTTRPMKGTRPRSQNRIKDRELKTELLKSAKDAAELMMIVDLERNDLGRVCSYDSIKVDALRDLEEYNTVYQTTATVSGRLHQDKDRIDLLSACFPGGSITGCPKIRSMEIIEELEPVRRSVYTGSLGYLSFSGGADFNILIRTILKKDDKLYFNAGGGIVTDSNPQEEYKETLVKAKAMLGAVNAL